MINNTSNDFHEIVIKELPLIDVRAPIEYEKGAFLNAVNLPILDDEDRRLVGTCYKRKGNEKAVELGHQLVSGDIKQSRIDAWIDYLKEHPNAMLYCFRGGQRSGITQQWIKEMTGKDVLRIEGGYKAFRTYLMNALEPSEQETAPIFLGGYTGSGKTILLNEIENAIDLEGLANHRGSSFGTKITGQPSQINFENNLAYELIKHKNKGYKHMVLEDESRNIGRCFIPKPLFEHFRSGGLVILEVAFEQRVQITMAEYVTESQADYINLFGNEQGLLAWSDYIRESIGKVKKRLGLDGYKRLSEVFEEALKQQVKTGKDSFHESWIHLFLKEYYDPMYQYQMSKTDRNIIFSGNDREVLEYLKGL